MKILIQCWSVRFYNTTTLCPILLEKFVIVQWHLHSMLADMLIGTPKGNQKHLALLSSQNIFRFSRHH